MSLRLARPVDAAAVLAMMDAGCELEARSHRVQVFGFPCFGIVRDDGVTVAAGGFVPRPERTPGEALSEAWFACRPDAAAHMLGIIRLTHLTLRRHCEDGPATVQAFVREGWRPGRRIAAALGFGFDRVESDPQLGCVERWTIGV
ncbi:hypothetical protein SAMN04515666_101345 [Bosea lupini]|uniref:N-acetyltransferase domain-containing protein n=1 Tax=Bosea lupini TaxID=1036779 RepID=A0A1H7GG60_9HYPH|nr:hypothetical protein [Bosea lupini]SEK37064.1 hypothetical protein SAMN04515666_101345 [Bosea lupini]